MDHFTIPGLPGLQIIENKFLPPDAIYIFSRRAYVQSAYWFEYRLWLAQQRKEAIETSVRIVREGLLGSAE